MAKRRSGRNGSRAAKAERTWLRTRRESNMLTPTGWRRTASVRWTIWIFFVPGRFSTKTPLYGCWISLDFLGFPWILSSELSLFNGLRGINAQKFFASLFRVKFESAGGTPAVEVMRKRRIAHEPSLTHFLIFCNRLSSSRDEAIGTRHALGRRNLVAASSRSTPRNQGPTNCSSAGSLPSETLSATLLATMG